MIHANTHSIFKEIIYTMGNSSLLNKSIAPCFIPSPLPMQYLGSKSRITNWIINSLRSEFPQANILVDLFAGSGIISCAALKYFPRIFSNDIQPYSYIILKSILCTPRDDLEKLANDILALSSEDMLLAGGRNENSQLLYEEDLHLKRDRNESDWQKYKSFCDNPNIIDGTKGSVDLLKHKRHKNLFVSYYANTYFGVRQCLELDALHEYAINLAPCLQTHLIASTISSMTYAVSSTTHLAQYLRPSSQQTTLSLKERRRKSIIRMVSERLKSLSTYPMPKKNGVALNLDFKHALSKIPTENNTVVYMDPPYFKEHYSRYYHVLDTFLLYDFPYLTYNKRLKKVTEGRYRENRFISDFGLRSKVEEAFKRAFIDCAEKDFCIAVSYASTSLISRECITDNARKAGYDVKVLEKELLHSGQGQPRNKKVTEFLFILNLR